MSTPSPLPMVGSASPRRASAPQIVTGSASVTIATATTTSQGTIGGVVNGGGRPKRVASEPSVGLPHANRATEAQANVVGVIGGGDGADGRTPMRRQSQIFKTARRSIDSLVAGTPKGPPIKTISGAHSSTSIHNTMGTGGMDGAQQRAVPHHLKCSLKVIFDQYS